MKTHPRHRIVAGLAVGALALAACGDDDGGGGDGGGGDGSGSPQEQVADLLLEELEGEELEGVTLDEDCVREATEQLSDEDAQAIVDAGPDGDADVTTSAEDFALDLLDCIDLDVSDLEPDG